MTLSFRELIKSDFKGFRFEKSSGSSKVIWLRFSRYELQQFGIKPDQSGIVDAEGLATTVKRRINMGQNVWFKLKCVNWQV